MTSKTQIRKPREPASASRAWSPESVAACVLTAGSALAWNPWGLNGFHAIKITTIAVSTLFALRTLLVHERLRVPPAWKWFTGFIGLATLSVALSGAVRIGLFGYPDRHAGTTLFLLMFVAYAVGGSLDPVGRRRVIYTAVAAATVLAALLVLQVIDVGVFADTALTGGRPTATFGSAAFAGAYLTTALPLVWYVRLEQTTKASRAVATAAAALIVVGLALTGARASWIGVGVALVVIGWTERGRLRSLGVAAAAVVAVVAVTAGLSSTVRDRFSSLFSPTEGTAGGRLALWEGVAPTVWQRPLLGWGPDGTRRGFPQNLPSDFERAFGVETIPDRAHNALFDIIIWVGIPAAIVALIGIFVVARTVARNDESTTQRTALIAAVAAFAAHLMFNFTTFELDVTVALLVGMLVAPATLPLRLPTSSAVVATWGVSVLIALAGLGGAMLIASDVAADRAVTAETEGDLESARSGWRTAVDLSFDDSQLLEGLARFEIRNGSFDQAITAADRAADVHSDLFTRELAAQTRLQRLLASGATGPSAIEETQSRYLRLVDEWDNHGSVHVGLGITYALAGDTERAASSFERAIEIRPTDVAALENLARIRLSTGSLDEAQELVLQALQVDPESETLLALRTAIAD